MADYKNAEGYPDPTAFGAFCAIEKEEKALRAFRPIVYICSPYAGDIETNTAAARRYCRFAVEAGYIPIAPHLLFPQFLNDSDPKERELGLFFGNALLSKCAEMFVFGSRISEGMEAEIKRATWKGHRIRYFTESCEEVTQTLTVGCKRNVKPELAEVKGKRLIIAAELEEGMRLNTSNVKQLCSTDEIYAEKKYKDPFSFVPSHTLVLYTNHLPKVGALDDGTWRRLIVIPFNAKIEGASDIKNYADYLYEKAGGAILKWIMNGAKRVIGKKFDIRKPAVVDEAIRKYKENNDWLTHFLDDCCEIDPSFSAKSGDVYNAYRSYCMQVGEYIRSTSDFYTALETVRGFDRRRTSKANIMIGLQLKSDFMQ